MDKTLFVTNTKDFDINWHYYDKLPERSLEHYHDYYEIAIFETADLNIFLKDKKYDIKDGDMLVIGEYEIHRIFYTAYTRYARYVISFRKRFMDEVLRSLGCDDILEGIFSADNRKTHPPMKQRNEIKTLLEELHKLARQPAGQDGMRTARIRLQMAQLLFTVKKCMSEDTLAPRSEKSEKLLKDIIGFIDINFRENLTLEMLEKSFYITKYYLCRLFKQQTGFTVFEYIQQRRVIEAQKMLRNTNMSIPVICSECGFNNAQHFFRVFREVSGVTPLKYRKQKSVPGGIQDV